MQIEATIKESMIDETRTKLTLQIALEGSITIGRQIVHDECQSITSAKSELIDRAQERLYGDISTACNAAMDLLHRTRDIDMRVSVANAIEAIKMIQHAIPRVKIGAGE